MFLFSEFKIDKICFYAEIISEKREIRWHLVRIRENFDNDFTKIEILYPEKSSEQVRSRDYSFVGEELRHCISHFFYLDWNIQRATIRNRDKYFKMCFGKCRGTNTANNRMCKNDEKFFNRRKSRIYKIEWNYRQWRNAC